MKGQANGQRHLVEWIDCVHSSPKAVAAGLRDIADRIEAEELTLISIYSTGFGNVADAALQVIAEDDHA